MIYNCYRETQIAEKFRRQNFIGRSACQTARLGSGLFARYDDIGGGVGPHAQRYTRRRGRKLQDGIFSGVVRFFLQICFERAARGLSAGCRNFVYIYRGVVVQLLQKQFQPLAEIDGRVGIFHIGLLCRVRSVKTAYNGVFQRNSRNRAFGISVVGYIVD